MPPRNCENQGSIGISVEVAEQAGVVEADPSALALGDVILEGLFRDRRPAIGRIVELDEELVLRERFVVDALGAGDVVDREVVLGGQLVQVEPGRIDELLMVAAAALRQRNHAELGRPRPRVRRLPRTVESPLHSPLLKFAT